MVYWWYRLLPICTTATPSRHLSQNTNAGDFGGLAYVAKGEFTAAGPPRRMYTLTCDEAARSLPASRTYVLDKIPETMRRNGLIRRHGYFGSVSRQPPSCSS